jgi:leucyl-tRNA---protein transferase
LGVLTFYRSRPTPCPYLPNRTEQQLFAELAGPQADETFQLLSRSGFRRTQHIIYRPACPSCNACLPVRIVLGEFHFGTTWRRVLRKNTEVKVEDVGLNVSDEQFELFRRYLRSRHEDGEMAKMNRTEFDEMILSSPVDTAIIEFRDPNNRLIACCFADRLDHGLSAVYTAFDPALHHRSLGSFTVLWMIQHAQALKLDYLYLGFWIDGSPKMAYKNRFRPLEAFGPHGWNRLTSP